MIKCQELEKIIRMFNDKSMVAKNSSSQTEELRPLKQVTPDQD